MVKVGPMEGKSKRSEKDEQLGTGSLGTLGRTA